MKQILIPILLTCFIINFLACSNDDDENCGTATVESLENLYGCENTAENMGFTFNSTYQIIRTQGSFDSLVLGNCKPIIDFSTYDLVIGGENLANLLSKIAYNYSPSCNGIDGTLEVKITMSDATSPQRVTYHALIPKLATGENISVDVQIE